MPAVLLFYGHNRECAEAWFRKLMQENDVSLEFIDDSFFSLPVKDFNTSFASSIKNRELRFYVASKSGDNNVAYCFDSDIVFSEKCRELSSLVFDAHHSIHGCKERDHTYENVLFFERGLVHPAESHIFPEFAGDLFNTIFGEDTSCWLEKPQYNNGVLVFNNTPDLAEAWRQMHKKGLFFPIVNPG